jgi:excisionase family DNA binding protein
MEYSRLETNSTRGQALGLRREGLSYAEIGRRLGVTRERARQLASANSRPKKSDLASKLMLTTGEAAQLLGVHPNTVRQWSKKGALPAFRVGRRGDRRFRREDIDSFLQHSEMERPTR